VGIEAQQLKSTFLFKNLNDEVLEAVANIAYIEEFQRGEKICVEGDPGDKFYLILSGEVRISKEIPGMGEEALAVLSRGEYFGEMSLIDDAPRSADVIAARRCSLSIITRADLAGLIRKNRELGYEVLWTFLRTLTARLRETNAKMTFLAAAGRFS
jgi:CRP-like cAMP-binding protein